MYIICLTNIQIFTISQIYQKYYNNFLWTTIKGTTGISVDLDPGLTVHDLGNLLILWLFVGNEYQLAGSFLIKGINVAEWIIINAQSSNLILDILTDYWIRQYCGVYLISTNTTNICFPFVSSNKIK